MGLDSSKRYSADAGISESEIETPRGGFMARPGLKAPPRHAVVVRCGDAPEPGEIPVARASFLPPPPCEPGPETSSEKVTLRAIPTPRLPQMSRDARAPLATHAASTPAVLESVPPPSDAPVVASVDRFSPVPRSRHAQRSRLTIAAAAVAGLLLGIISVVTTVHVREAQEPASAAALPAGVEIERATQGEVPNAQPAPTTSSAPRASVTATPDAVPAVPAAAPRGGAVKRSIF
jgi:hypothetical protein